LKANLLKKKVPNSAENCEYCNYIATVNQVVGEKNDKNAGSKMKDKKSETIKKSKKETGQYKNNSLF